MLRILILLALSAASSAALAERYKYVSYGAPEEYRSGQDVLTIDTESRDATLGGAKDELHFCADSSPYHCFYNVSISFSVPKHRLTANEKWTGRDAEFSVTRADKLTLLGKSIDVWVIRARRTGRLDIFYYSETCGLVAIKYISPDPAKRMNSPVYFLDGVRGFPVADTARR